MNRRQPRSQARTQARRAGDAYGSRAPSGPMVGPVMITPVRLVLFVALVGSLAFLLFALTVRDESQIPMLGAGAAVLGFVLLGLAGVAFLAIRRAGREGRDRQAVVVALLGGLSAIAGLMGIAFAMVLGMVWQG